MGDRTSMAEKEAAGKKPALARTVRDKWRAKQWYKLRAPSLFQHVEIGETMATEPALLSRRTIEVTMQELSGGGDLSKAHIKLRFQIERIAGDNVAETRLLGHELTTDYVRRLARRKRSKIDTSLLVRTKDGVEMRLKAVAVGEHRLQTRLRTALRNRLRALLSSEAEKRTAAEFVMEMLQGELTKTLSQGLRSLYPLKKIELRRSEILGAIPEGPLPAPATPEPEIAAPPASEDEVPAQ